ncbi:hypothetical protein [Corallococcus sp. 4LFB]|uniref:hypothetical protein n=1 Tax=Corallococcus sp. 4LFB TaxID=3383249 RepID=UPI003976E77C
MIATPSSCLTDEVLVELLEDQLTDEALAQVHRHAAGCAECRGLLATLTPGIQRSEVDAPRERETDSLPPEPVPWTPPPTLRCVPPGAPAGPGGHGHRLPRARHVTGPARGGEVHGGGAAG